MDCDETFNEGVAVTEVILEAIAEGAMAVQAGAEAGDVAEIYNKVFIDATIEAARLSGARTQLERYQAGLEEASALFMRSVYMTGVYVQHVIEAEGLSLEAALDIMRESYET